MVAAGPWLNSGGPVCGSLSLSPTCHVSLFVKNIGRARGRGVGGGMSLLKTFCEGMRKMCYFVKCWEMFGRKKRLEEKRKRQNSTTELHQKLRSGIRCPGGCWQVTLGCRQRREPPHPGQPLFRGGLHPATDQRRT